jgi:hypothetical protein
MDSFRLVLERLPDASQAILAQPPAIRNWLWNPGQTAALACLAPVKQAAQIADFHFQLSDLLKHLG